jgi:energy-coupling factor transporter ATP-binding protein EcfA2
MVRLTRLKIDRFRNVKSGTVLDFGPTFNVLLGKNATGKTTLLDLIAAVTNDDLSAYAKEDAGFDLTWWIELRGDLLEVRAERTPVISGEPIPAERQEREFDDRLTIVLKSNEAEVGRLLVIGTQGSWTPRDSEAVHFDVKTALMDRRVSQRVLFAALTAEGGRPTPRALGTLMYLSGHVGRFDEALLTLDAITQSSALVVSRGPGQPLSGSFDFWLPSEVRDAVLRMTAPDSPAISFANLGSLSGVPGSLGFTSGALHLRLTKRSPDAGHITTTYQGIDFLFQRADGSQISHQLLSFGQKRLFAFLWYLAVRGQLPVVADELLNGLHHEWIEICLERLRERQSFLATQHPYLLDHIPIESAARVRTTFLRCTLEPGPDGREQMVWRNFNEEEAERFFIAYQTGIPQVSEVLLTEGLW